MIQTNVKTVRTDMKTLLQDAQDLFRQATSATGEKADMLRTQGANLIDTAMVKAQEMQVAAVETGKEIAESADNYVQENPWKSVAISAGVGVLIGMLIGRK
jgi:ElaB/YqjD/DUF883 family membrane-anchored ribosome-binding protein